VELHGEKAISVTPVSLRAIQQRTDEYWRFGIKPDALHHREIAEGRLRGLARCSCGWRWKTSGLGERAKRAACENPKKQGRDVIDLVSPAGATKGDDPGQGIKYRYRCRCRNMFAATRYHDHGGRLH